MVKISLPKKNLDTPGPLVPIYTPSPFFLEFLPQIQWPKTKYETTKVSVFWRFFRVQIKKKKDRVQLLCHYITIQLISAVCLHITIQPISAVCLHITVLLLWFFCLSAMLLREWILLLCLYKKISCQALQVFRKITFYFIKSVFWSEIMMIQSPLNKPEQAKTATAFFLREIYPTIAVSPSDVQYYAL